MRKSFQKALSLALAAAMTISLGSGIAAPQETDAKVVDKKITTNAPYHGFLCFQSGQYTFRNAYDAATYGVAGTDADSKQVSGYDWLRKFCYNQPDGTATMTTEFRGKKITVPKKTKLVAQYADFSCPDITYDGTYTVSMSNFGADTFKYDAGWNMLFVDTEIPLTNKNVKFSNISLKVDGAELYKSETVKIRNNKDCPNTYQLMAINIYGFDNYGTSTQKENSLGDGVADCINANYPKQSIEITFTVSGMGAAPTGYQADNLVYTAPASPDSGNPASGPSVSTTQTAVSVSSLAKGKTFTAGNLTYKVTKASDKSGSATVAVAGVKKSAQKKTSLSVPKTVTNAKFKYKVTAVNGKAFAKCKKLKKVTLGANVKTLEKNSFAKCTKLSSLKVDGKLTKVKKKAFAGCKKTIKVSGKSKKANIKALKKSGYKKFK